MPAKSELRPIGSCRGSGVTPSFSSICFTTDSGLAPMRSILLMKAIRGTW